MEKQKFALKIVKKESKSKQPYFNLFVDYGFRKQSLTYDTAIIVSILDCPMSTLYDLCKNFDDEIVVAYLDFNIDKV